MIVAILISVHLLADFLFQSSAVLERKRQERKFLFLHCFIYFIVFEILFFILFQCKKVFLLGLIISILHFLTTFIFSFNSINTYCYANRGLLYF